MPYNSKLKFFHQCEKFKLLSVILLSAATLGLFETDGRYTILDQGLLPNLDFQQIGRYWRGTVAGVNFIPGPPATLVLRTSGRRQTFVVQTLANPHRFENIRIAVEARFDGIEAGRAWWQKAGVFVQSFDGNGDRMVYWPSEVAFLTGTHPWHRYDVVIPTNAAMKKMDIFILHGGKSGELRVRNLQVDFAEEAIWFSTSENALLYLWITAGIWILLPLAMQNRRAPLACLTLAAFIGILAISVLPQPLLSTSSKLALDKVAIFMTPAKEDTKTTAENVAQWEPSKNADNAKRPKKESVKGKNVQASKAQIQFKGDRQQYVAHFLSHAVLALLAGLAFSRAGWWRLSVCLLLASSTNEILQIFVVTRSAGLADGAANIAGAAAGLLLIYAYHFLRQRLTA